jgi:hypothetical protein
MQPVSLPANRIEQRQEAGFSKLFVCNENMVVIGVTRLRQNIATDEHR